MEMIDQADIQMTGCYDCRDNGVSIMIKIKSKTSRFQAFKTFRSSGKEMQEKIFSLIN